MKYCMHYVPCPGIGSSVIRGPKGAKTIFERAKRQKYPCTQGQINHGAVCTMGGDHPPPGGHPPPGAPDQLPNYYHAVLTFKRLKVQCRLKRNDDD